MAEVAAAPVSAAVGGAAAEGGAAGGDHPPVDKKELWGWFAYDWANSAVSSVVISGFLPLLVQECALAAAGFPQVCPNAFARAASPQLWDAVFANASLPESVSAAAYTYNGEPDPAYWPSPARCTLYAGDGQVYCPGYPASSDSCLNAGGRVGDLFPLRVSDGMTVWEPSAYTAAMVSVSVGIQMFVFVSLGAFADFGPWRKHFLVSLSVAGSILCVLGVSVGVSNWWAGGLLTVLINVLYGTSFVFYDGWLPLLAANDPQTLAAPPATRDAVFMERMSDISSRGFAWGYLGSVICLLICVAVTIVSETSIVAYRINVLIAGLWWFFFALFTYAWLRPRPGPAFPKGENVLLLPWRELYNTITKGRTELRQTLVFLVAYFVYSDGYSVISSVGAQYANQYVNWAPLPKSLGLAALLVIVPIFAGLGAVFFNHVEKKYKVGPARIIIINCVIMALVPAYGLLGFADRRLGFRRGWEMLLGVIAYGFNLGSVQSFSRAAYAGMIPEGEESHFFSLFQFTSKGSSWIGPGVVAAVIQGTGNIRAAFVYPLVALLLPIYVVFTVDYAKGERDARMYAAKHGTALGVAFRGAMTVAGHEREVLLKEEGAGGGGAAEEGAAAAVGGEGGVGTAQTAG